MQYEFGTGSLFGKSLNAGVQTPVQFGALQGVTVDFSFTQKELYSKNQFPIALARGTGKISGKADFAQFNAQVFNDLFFGASSVSAGAVRTVTSEAQTTAGNTPTATATNGGNFAQDLGVTLAATGVVLTAVANAPVAGQYTCNATSGVYTFNAAQANTPVFLNYTYNDSVTGKKITITNQLLGTAPQFMAVFTQQFQNKMMTIVLNACMSSKLGLATKLEDFTQPGFDFMAFSDAAGNIGSINLEE